mgnify:CR=1 FL=1
MDSQGKSGSASTRDPGLADSWVIGTDGTIESVDVYYDPSPLVAALHS